MKFFKVFLSLALLLSSLNGLAQALADQSEDSGRTPVPTGKYITGGILGSAAGFGIGHAIQGRYGDKGWIFTATEATGLVVMSIGAGQCQKDKDDGTITECTKSQKSLMLTGFGVFLGFHIWEVLDVWLKARPVDEKVSAFLIPDPQAPALGIVYRF